MTAEDYVISLGVWQKFIPTNVQRLLDFIWRSEDDKNWEKYYEHMALHVSIFKLFLCRNDVQ